MAAEKAHMVDIHPAVIRAQRQRQLSAFRRLVAWFLKEV